MRGHSKLENFMERGRSLTNQVRILNIGVNIKEKDMKGNSKMEFAQKELTSIQITANMKAH